jgi:hypothetical protein
MLAKLIGSQRPHDDETPVSALHEAVAAGA